MNIFDNEFEILNQMANGFNIRIIVSGEKFLLYFDELFLGFFNSKREIYIYLNGFKVGMCFNKLYKYSEILKVKEIQ